MTESEIMKIIIGIKETETYYMLVVLEQKRNLLYL